MIKTILKQFNRHPIGLLFLIMGYIISLLVISIGTTNMVEMKQLALARTEGTPKNALVINSNIIKDINFKQYLEIFNGLKKDTTIRFSTTGAYIDESDKNKTYGITYELFSQTPDWTYPLIEGHYYTPSDIQESKKVVLIGKDLERYTSKVDNVKYVAICGEKYEVIGIIGQNKKKSPWDSNLCMPITSIPELYKKELLDSESINCTIYNSNTSTLDDYHMIEKNILKLNNKASISVNELSTKNDLIANSLGSSNRLKITSALIFIISLINSINITSYWINDRKTEIGIKKAFGHTDFNISYMLISEMLSINSLACVASLLLQYTLGLFTEHIYGISLNISVDNFLVGVLVVFISSIITSIIPIYKSLNIQPIEALKI